MRTWYIAFRRGQDWGLVRVKASRLTKAFRKAKGALGYDEARAFCAAPPLEAVARGEVQAERGEQEPNTKRSSEDAW